MTGCSQSVPHLQTDRGRLDLHDFAHDVARVDGTMMFHPSRLVTDIQAAGPAADSRFVTVPDQWKDPSGYGTYHLVMDSVKDQQLALVMGVPFSAWRLTVVDGKQSFTQSQGNFGTSAETCIPRMKEALVYLPKIEQSQVDVYIEVCNFHNIKAGLRKHIYVGRPGPLTEWFYGSYNPKLIVLGTFLIIAIYFGTMAVLNSSRRESSIFLFICIGGALRLICTNSYLESTLVFLDPLFAFELRYKLEYAVFVIPTCGFIAITSIYFPDRLSRTLLLLSIVTIAPLLLYTMVTDYRSWGRYAFYFQIHLIVFTFVGVALNLVATLRRREYSLLNFLATLLPAVSVPYDILLSLGLVKGTAYAFDYFFASFLVLHTVIFVFRFKNMSVSNLHAYNQLTKVVYPHQIERIKQGLDLEHTMPTTPGEACVLSFDIIGSSRIQHEKSKEFFRNVFRRCNEVMMEGYDGNHLRAHAYRIKEMGDGFLCSVGYPFQSPTGFMANDAFGLAVRFYKILQEESQLLHMQQKVACGIGLALDSVLGFYPDSGTKEYDLFGRAIILATRYEQMRKSLPIDAGCSVLTVQERVYHSLHPALRKVFVQLDLQAAGLAIRDDATAERLYYVELDQLIELDPILLNLPEAI